MRELAWVLSDMGPGAKMRLWASYESRLVCCLRGPHGHHHSDDYEGVEDADTDKFVALERGHGNSPC